MKLMYDIFSRKSEKNKNVPNNHQINIPCLRETLMRHSVTRPFIGAPQDPIEQMIFITNHYEPFFRLFLHHIIKLYCHLYLQCQYNKHYCAIMSVLKSSPSANEEQIQRHNNITYHAVTV